MKFLFTAALLIFSVRPSVSQLPSLAVNKWVKELSDPSDQKNAGLNTLYDSIITKKDTAWVHNFKDQLRKSGDTGNPYFLVRFTLFKALSLNWNDHLRSSFYWKTQVLQHVRQALQTAYELNDEYLVAAATLTYFRVAKYYGNYEESVMYGMYSAELYEQLYGSGEFPHYQFLAEMMYRVREYTNCIAFCSKYLAARPKDTLNYDSFRMLALNTMALAYHRTGRYDSAMHFYRQALEVAHQIRRKDWDGIISGNMGQVHYLLKEYDSAIALLEKDYRISMEYKYYDNAANSLQWAALAHAAKGNTATALNQVRTAMALIRQMPDEGYEQNIYKAAVTIYQVNGKMDSAVYYAAQYQRLHDAIEKKINTSSAAISGIRLKEEKSRYKIRRLQEEKKAQVQQRNFIIAGIILLAIISVLVVNRQRQRLKYRQQNIEKEKRLIENEVAAARQQMEMFTQSIIEKTNLIEKLEQQMKESNATAGHQETISALSGLTILTEEDWDKFKMLFEKIYPMFFQRIKAKAPDITIAEQRMAALTRLQLTTRQMASMQGISPDSVHKTRQRLRQRLQLSNDINVEAFITSI